MTTPLTDSIPQIISLALRKPRSMGGSQRASQRSCVKLNTMPTAITAHRTFKAVRIVPNTRGESRRRQSRIRQPEDQNLAHYHDDGNKNVARMDPFGLRHAVFIVAADNWEIVAKAAQTAVSVRSTKGPSDAPVHPARCNCPRSASVHPPSGPIRSEVLSPGLNDTDRASNGAPGCSSSQSRCVEETSSAASKRTASPSPADARRLDCSLASRAIRRQRSSRFFAPSKKAALAACRLHRYDPRHPEFRGFLHRPFEALKPNQRQIEIHLRQFRPGIEFFDGAELHQILPRRIHRRQPDPPRIRNLVFLTHLHTQYACQMMGLVAADFRAPFTNLIDEKPPACHVQ